MAAEACGAAEGRRQWMDRVEIDTSAPFESVREAVDMFGGSGHWRPRDQGGRRRATPDEKVQNPCCNEESDTPSVEAEAAKQVRKDLAAKEQETLEILKQLDATKRILTGLKSKLRDEPAGSVPLPDDEKEENSNMGIEVHHPVSEEEAQSQGSDTSGKKPSTGLVLMELEQAKVNLCRATSDLSGLRCSVEFLNQEFEKEKSSLEKTRKKLASNSCNIPFLEKEVDQAKLGLEVNASNKMKEEEEEEADATESAPFSEFKALRCSSNVTLPVEEYNFLTRKAREADELSRKKVEEAMALVDEANKSKSELLEKVERVKDEVRTSRTAMEEALQKVEAANRGKLAVEEALRQWRSDQGQKRRGGSTRKSPKFKTSSSSSSSHTAAYHRRNSCMVDVNGRNLTSDDCSDDKTELKSTAALSIGEILSRKLMGSEEFEKRGGQENRYGEPEEVSLAQMLGRRKDGVLAPCGNVGNNVSAAKKKKFGFGINLAKHDVSMKKKNKRSDSERQHPRS